MSKSINDKEQYVKSLKGTISDTELRKKIGEIFKVAKTQRQAIFNRLFGADKKEFKVLGDKAVAEVKGVADIKTLEDLISYCEIDQNEWQCKKFVVNKYSENYQVKGEFERKKSEKSLEKVLEKFIVEAEKHAPKNFDYKRINSGDKGLYVLSIQDLHLAKLAHGEQTGWGDYKIATAKEYYKNAVEQLMSGLDQNKIGKIVLIVGSDTIHYENDRIETTSGTKIEGDSRWHKSFDETCEMISETIEKLASKFEVEAVVIGGNHARLSEYALGSYLKAFFRNHPNVKIDNSPLNRKYISHGKTLIGLCHGDGVKKLETLGAVIYRENLDTISNYKNIFWITGHKHVFQQMMDERGVRIFVSAALCPPDQWHSSNNYTGSIQSAEGYLFSKETGLEQIIFTKPVNIK